MWTENLHLSLQDHFRHYLDELFWVSILVLVVVVQHLVEVIAIQRAPLEFDNEFAPMTIRQEEVEFVATDPEFSL